MNINATVSIERIGPEQAQALLSNQVEGQRRRRLHYIKRLAKEMASERWKLSPDAIVLINGILANGQHRLTAVAESGITQEFIVLRSGDENLFKIIDCGMRRTESDVAGPLANSTTAVAAARLILRYDKRPIGGSALLAAYSLTRGDVLEFIDRNRGDLEESTRFCYSLYHKQRILAASLGAALHFLLVRDWPRDQADAFMESVYAGNSTTDATYELRERLVKNSISKAKLHQENIFALVIKAANSWIGGKRIGNLKFATYPQLVRAA